MPIVVLILLVFAFVFFAIAAFTYAREAPAPGRWHFIAAGLACWVLAQLLEAVPGALK